MSNLNCFRDGFIFTSGEFFRHQGAYTNVPQRPGICDKCHSDAGSFHAHGRFKRTLSTLKQWTITKISLWKHRWLCLKCNRTMSTGPPDVLPYKHYCTLIIVAFLWGYLNGNSSIHNSMPPQLENGPSPRTITRYLNRAKAVCEETYQAIKEVLNLKNTEPCDEVFAQGLSPPERLKKWHRDPKEAFNLWRVLAVLLIHSDAIMDTPCFFMARARLINQNKNITFLL